VIPIPKLGGDLHMPDELKASIQEAAA
jgi:hypothetical protein